ncbi:MAG TPA: DNA cytosine methyltransferase [Jatrophihabitans sp.]|nr:DNA cytosine methyltransferase [Jatrophihabitans sp.]
MSLTVTDLFCGAGGSGLGARAAGFRLVMAANHWTRAIETHAANFPDTEHDCADISQVDPRRYPLTDVLWASPECTNHSQAKGVSRRLQNQPDLFGDVLPDEAAERSRATMWDVPRFAERHPYRAVVVENVVEAAKWVMFPAWLQAMNLLGYEHQLVSLNSMHAQAIDAPRAPQSRDRLYIVFHRKGQRRPNVAPRPLAWCERCGLDVAATQAWKPGRTVGRYRTQYIYVCGHGHTVEPYALPAAAAIDWSMPGLRIGDRDRPLSPKTIARIEAGLRKYGTAQPHLTLFRSGQPRPSAVSDPFHTIVSNGSNHALVVPVEGREAVNARLASDPLRTQTARLQDALVVPSGGTWRESATSTREPFSTVTTRETDALVVPYYGTAGSASSVDEPIGTLTTKDRYGVAFIAELRGGGSHARDVREPLATVTASGNHHMLVRNNGDGSAAAGMMCTPASEPMRTVVAITNQSLVSIEQAVHDCTFRMLEPHEIQAAMAFGSEYRVLGNRREKVRQLGNGVTPPAAEFLLRAVAESLGGAA